MTLTFSSTSSQAHAMQQVSRVTPPRVVAQGVPTALCASGRGGSGTTLVAALLAVAAVSNGHRVLLVDSDEVTGPLSMLLGVQPVATWQQLRSSNIGAEQVVTRVSDSLMLVAGGVPRDVVPAPISAAERRACMRRLLALGANVDFVVIDCGSRLDALSAAIAPHGGERLFAVSGASDPVALAATYALCKAALQRHAGMSLEVLVNRLHDSEAHRCFDALDAGAQKFLGSSLHLAGAVPFDASLNAALNAGMPFWDAVAGSPVLLPAHDVVTRMLAAVTPVTTSRSEF